MLGEVFDWYWKNKQKARELYPALLQEEQFGKSGKGKVATQSKKPPIKTIIIEEGAEGHSNSKVRKRSKKLLEEGRKYFKKLDHEGELRCQACKYIKPNSIEREIIQLHHTEMISELDKNGKTISLEAALKALIPLCPNCHQIAHSSKPPYSVKDIKKILNNNRG